MTLVLVGSMAMAFSRPEVVGLVEIRPGPMGAHAFWLKPESAPSSSRGPNVPSYCRRAPTYAPGGMRENG